MSDVLVVKLEQLKSSIGTFDPSVWKSAFLKRCAQIDGELRTVWDSEWASKCNGKELLETVCREYQINRDRREIKRDLVRRIRDQKSTEWQKVRDLLTKAFGA
jgi:hypothetical protein